MPENTAGGQREQCQECQPEVTLMVLCYCVKTKRILNNSISHISATRNYIFLGLSFSVITVFLNR
jgi:hypothetical protein